MTISDKLVYHACTLEFRYKSDQNIVLLALTIGPVPFLWNMFYYTSTIRGQQEFDFSILNFLFSILSLFQGSGFQHSRKEKKSLDPLLRTQSDIFADRTPRVQYTTCTRILHCIAPHTHVVTYIPRRLVLRGFLCCCNNRQFEMGSGFLVNPPFRGL